VQINVLVYSVCTAKGVLVDVYLVDCIMYFSMQALIATFMVMCGNIGSLIDFFSFTAWIFYGGAMLAVIVQRFTRPDAPRPYKASYD